MWRFISFLRLQKQCHPWIISTLNRKMAYTDYNDIFKSYRIKKVFSKIDDENLNIYINSIIQKNNEGLRITYPKELEYQIYKSGLFADMYIWENIKKIDIPCLIIRAEESNAFLDSSKEKISKLNPKINFHTIENSTHLFPLEYPKETVNVINDFI